MRTRALVLLNPQARRGRGRRRFERVRATVGASFDAAVVETDAQGAWRDAVRRAVGDGVTVFIAAGGDGTVHALANALVATAGDATQRLTLGAVGLGSSNDFHKPWTRRVRGIPVRLDDGRATPRDLIRVRFADGAGRVRSRVAVVSASLGLTARANAYFNEGRGVMRRLRGAWPQAAILYAALRTLWRHQPLRAALRIDGRTWRGRFASLSQLKTPHLAGSLRFDTPVAPGDGRFAVNLLEAMSRARLLRALLDLARGRFRGRPGTRAWSARRLDVELETTQELELDGEVVRARRARFDIVPEGIRLCA